MIVTISTKVIVLSTKTFLEKPEVYEGYTRIIQNICMLVISEKDIST